MTKKRCLKLMMSYLCSSKWDTEQWYRWISTMLEPPVRNVDVLLAFHGVACGYLPGGRRQEDGAVCGEGDGTPAQEVRGQVEDEGGTA